MVLAWTSCVISAVRIFRLIGEMSVYLIKPTRADKPICVYFRWLTTGFSWKGSSSISWIANSVYSVQLIIATTAIACPQCLITHSVLSVASLFMSCRASLIFLIKVLIISSLIMLSHYSTPDALIFIGFTNSTFSFSDDIIALISGGSLSGTIYSFYMLSKRFWRWRSTAGISYWWASN